MKICVYSDVHSNLYALESLMQTDDYKSADLRIFLGDIVAVCPFPNECIENVLKSGDIWLMGNHDCYYAFGLPKEEFPYFQGERRKHQHYVKRIVKKEYEKVFMSLPKSCRLKIDGKTFYFVHFPWETQRLVMDEPEIRSAEVFDELFKSIKADYIFFGHEHISQLYKSDKATYVGVNALGVRHPAHYLMIEVNENGVSFEDKTVDYDVKRLRKDILKANYPWAKEYTAYILED